MKFTFFKIFLWILLIYSQVAVAQTIRFGSWNIEWLATQGVDKFKASQRKQNDFDALEKYARQLNSPIVALQEINDVNAAKKVFGDEFTIILSSRASSSYSSLQFDDINQYTGFALHSSVELLENPADLTLESTPYQKLRFATYIVIEHNGQPLHLLSIHLKAGCPSAKKNNRSCELLGKQANQLNQWMTERVSNNQPFAIMGDFNHDLAYSNDWLLGQLIDNIEGEVNLATQHTAATCQVRSYRDPNQTHQYRYLIDHILSYKLKKHSPAKQQNYALNDVTNYRLSDHCPIYADYSTAR
jgi:endonuclease/exonuclease/phosphatase family metal-dependent hydrolase